MEIWEAGVIVSILNDFVVCVSITYASEEYRGFLFGCE